jgi:hypothetical protein
MVVGLSALVLISFVAACTINMEAQVTTQHASVSCDYGLFDHQANELSLNFTPSCWPDHAFLRGDVSTVKHVLPWNGQALVQYVNDNNLTFRTTVSTSIVSAACLPSKNDANFVHKPHYSQKMGSLDYQIWARTHGYAPLRVSYAISKTAHRNIPISREISEPLGGGAKTDEVVCSGVDPCSDRRVVVFSLLQESNIFHQFAYSDVLPCVVELIATRANLTIYLKGYLSDNSAHVWIREIVHQVMQANTPLLSRSTTDQLLSGDEETMGDQARCFGEMYSTLFSSVYFELNREVVPSLISLQALLLRDKQQQEDKQHQQQERDSSGYVLLLQRSPRTLVDKATGLFSTIAQTMCDRGLQLQVATLGSLPPKGQFSLVRGASIIIAVHGAELTNMLFLNPKSAVIEITLRYGWCCDPVPEFAQGYQTKTQCVTSCKPYHKADFANLAHALGHTYFYFDPSYIEPPTDKNPISREKVFVDSKGLATLAQVVLSMVNKTTPRTRNNVKYDEALGTQRKI